ncbi:MAG: hypothetical protein ABIV47_08045 [Roseiflexaceae bacterium]
MKPKVYESFAQQKIDQRIGFVAFLIVNIVVGLLIGLLSSWVDSITIEPTARHPNFRLAIALLPWVANALLLIWALIFRRYIAVGYLVCLGGLLVVGAVLALIGVVSFFISVPVTALFELIGTLLFLVLTLVGSIWFILKVIPIFRNWWEI